MNYSDAIHMMGYFIQQGKNYMNPIEMLDAIDEECREHGLPPLSRLVTDVPGRPDATQAEVQEVYDAAKEGKYWFMEAAALRSFGLN